MPQQEADKRKGKDGNEDLAQNRLPALDLAGAARTIRLALKLTQAKVADGLGFHPAAWRNVESHGKNVGPKTIEALPEVLDVPMAWLAVLAISDPGPQDDPVARLIRAAQRRIYKELEKRAAGEVPTD